MTDRNHTDDELSDDVAQCLKSSGMSDKDVASCRKAVRRDAIWSAYCPLWLARMHQATLDQWYWRWARMPIRGLSQFIAQVRAWHVELKNKSQH